MHLLSSFCGLASNLFSWISNVAELILLESLTLCQGTHTKICTIKMKCDPNSDTVTIYQKSKFRMERLGLATSANVSACAHHLPLWAAISLGNRGLDSDFDAKRTTHKLYSTPLIHQAHTLGSTRNESRSYRIYL